MADQLVVTEQCEYSELHLFVQCLLTVKGICSCSYDQRLYLITGPTFGVLLVTNITFLGGTLKREVMCCDGCRTTYFQPLQFSRPKQVSASEYTYMSNQISCHILHHDVIKWKPFLRYWTFLLRIHRSAVNFPNKGQWRGALIFSLICPWISGWVNNREAGDLRPHHVYYVVTVMCGSIFVNREDTY